MITILTSAVRSLLADDGRESGEGESASYRVVSVCEVGIVLYMFLLQINTLLWYTIVSVSIVY